MAMRHWSPLSTTDPESIDRILVYAVNKDIMRLRYGVIKCGLFEFHVNTHSTGNSVEVFIVKDDLSYRIINCTWWFSSQYTFNESQWDEGKWDAALTEAMLQIRTAVLKHRQAVEEEKADREAADAKVALLEKQAFEQLFE
jgi:hypothetical protein